MENSQLLPFERNRYYAGKLLTSADFQAEQTYFNNKRRFVNEMMFGAGIVCGMGVFNLDDVSVMVESGVAVDALGREIVLESSVVKKLSSIDGFEGLQSDCAALCVRFNEQAVHPVYAVNRRENGEEYELNRVREGFQLFVEDAAPLSDLPGIEYDFMRRAELYADDDFCVTVSIPATVPCGAVVKLEVAVRKLSDAPKVLTMSSIIQTPSFVDQSGEHELLAAFDDISPEKGGVVRREFWLTAQLQEASDSAVIARTEGTRLLIDGGEKKLNENLIMKVMVENVSRDDLVAREVGKINLETRSLSDTTDYIRLADIHMQTTKNAYVIDRIVETGVKRYIPTAASDALRREYNSWFGGVSAAHAQESAAGDAKTQAGAEYREPVYATGVLEIPLDANVRRGQVLYSDEIMHGLGKGNVYVEAGFEYLAEDPRAGGAAKHTIFGDPELFLGDNPPIAFAQTAVKVLNDRGSFIVAARITRETNYVLLVLRWVAIKLPMSDDKSVLQRLAGKSIAAAQPTVVLATRESHYFGVKFKNMEPCALSYELTEKDSGSITPDGIYTAPSKEGVYEIHISCSDMPLISTYAYAVVKKKELMEAETADEA